MEIKEWCSCIRNKNKIEEVKPFMKIVDINNKPKEGDLILVSVVDLGNAYNCIENIYGRDVKLFPGDTIMCVIGTRKSGTKLSGTFDKNYIETGQALELLSLGGIVGKSICVPNYFGGTALKLRVEGFPEYNNSILNCKDFSFNESDTGKSQKSAGEQTKIVFIGGTSAESGKTTLLCKAVRAVKELYPTKKIGALKIVGTGRLSDILNYKDAGADYISDYVDEGWPSTYNISSLEYSSLLDTMIKKAKVKADIIFIEIGGDLLEGGAIEAMLCASKLKSHFFLLANDAMGAQMGMQILYGYNIENIKISTLTQNPISMADRLGIPKVIDVSSAIDIKDSFQNFTFN